MKKYLLHILLPLSLLFACLPARAGGFKGGINWEMTSPIGNYTLFANQYSLRGASGWIDFSLLRKLSIGLEAGWHQTFENKSRRTFYPGDNQAVTAATYNSLSDIPLMANVKFMILARGIVRPYVSLGLGANYIRREIVYLDQVLSDGNWGFNLAPSVGTYITFGEKIHMGLNIFARYGISFNEFEYDNRTLGPYQYVNVGVGLLFH